MSSERIDIALTVNGTPCTGVVEPRTNLADFLRHDLGLTGTHVGCEHGSCGACTIVVDGVAARSCLMLAVQADGALVETIEGLATDDQLNPLQQAFWERHGLQCGFCTPGVLMTLTAYLREDPTPDAETLRVVLSGNLCRCTGYQNIVAAALDAAAQMRKGVAA